MTAPLTYSQAHGKMPRMTDTLKTHGEAIDAFLGEMARLTRSRSTRNQYEWILNHVADDACKAQKLYVNELTEDDYERTLNRWTDLAASTISQRVSCMRTFSKFVWRKGWAASWVCADFERPRRPRPEDVAVVSVSTREVLAMFAAVEDWQELLCIATAAYLGARRKALASVRRRDVDLEKGLIRFHEKGAKTIVKPLPHEYAAILRDADDDGVWASPEDYLIPNRRPAAVRGRERSDKVIWETIKRLARRANVTCHVHALRAAFAVAFIEAHPGDAIALMQLLGHKRVETTYAHYLRRLDKARAMEAVLDLSWNAPSALPVTVESSRGPYGIRTRAAVVGVDQPLLRQLELVRARPVVRDPRSRA